MLGAILEAVRNSAITNTIDSIHGINGTEKRLLLLIAEGEFYTAAEASLLMGVSKRTIERSLASLKNKGLIVREGSDKSGKWKVLLS